MSESSEVAQPGHGTPSLDLEQLNQLLALRQRERDDATRSLMQERKRFDTERQQLRAEITALRQSGQDAGQEESEFCRQLMAQEIALKRERDDLIEELTELRRQALDLEESRLEVQQLTESLRQATVELDALRAKQPVSQAPAPLPAAVAPEPPAPTPAAAAPPVAKAKAAPVAETEGAEPPAPKLAGDLPIQRPISALAQPGKPPVLPIRPLAKSWQERRRSPRRRGNPIPVVLDAGNETFGGWVTDRSAGGLRLLVDQEFAVGCHFKVRSAREPNALWIDIEIKHRLNDSGSWSIGCQFVKEKELTWQDRQQFG